MLTGNSLRKLAKCMLDILKIMPIYVVPSYSGTIEVKYKTQKYYEEEIYGVKVVRIRVLEFSKTNKKSRVKNIVSYFVGGMGETRQVVIQHTELQPGASVGRWINQEHVDHRHHDVVRQIQL